MSFFWKKLYNSEINSAYVRWPERKEKYILAQSVHWTELSPSQANSRLLYVVPQPQSPS